MRRIRNPRYAPEFLERKLNPGATAGATAAFVAYVPSAPLDYPTFESIQDAGPYASPAPVDPAPAGPITPLYGDGTPPVDPIPLPLLDPVGPA